MSLRPIPSLLGALIASACTVPADTSRFVPEAGPVAEARQAMLGMDETDIRMCAGFPTAQIDMGARGTIWTYVSQIDRSGISVTLPTLGTGPLQGTAGSVSLTDAASCRTQLRFQNGHVVQVEFAGDNNSQRAINAMCTPQVDGCVRYREDGRASGLAPSPDPAPALAQKSGVAPSAPEVETLRLKQSGT